MRNSTKEIESVRVGVSISIEWSQSQIILEQRMTKCRASHLTDHSG